MMNGRGMTALLGIFLVMSWVGSAYADSAEVLPKGVFSIGFDSNIYLPVSKRFDRDGNKQDAASDFNNVNLNSATFPLLSPLDPFTGGPGTATIGRTEVSFKYDFTIINFNLAYGITKDLSFGMKIPYWWVKNNVKANVNTSSATVGKNPGFVDNGAAGPPLIPVAAGGVRFTNEDVQNLLGGGIDVNNNGTVDVPGFGFKRFETWSNEGFSDIEAGFKYQYYKSEDWRLAVTAGVKFPTGKKDDPDNLVDYPLGGGAYGISMRLHNDYTGLKNWVFDGTIRYNIALPFKTELRVVDPRQPIGGVKENVERTPGGTLELEASAGYDIGKGFRAGALYMYGNKQTDKVSGNKGLDYTVLERDTNYIEHVYIVGVSYSTVPLYVQKSFPIPLNVSLSYRDRFAGKNFILNSQYISLSVQTFF
jgi:hypothetical protein